MTRLRPLLTAGIGLAALVWVAGAPAATGELQPRGCIDDAPIFPELCTTTTAGLESPAALAESPDRRFVYVTSAVDHAIVRFKRNRKSGKLTPRGCIENQEYSSDECAREARAIGFPSGIAISRDGRFAYVTADGPDTLVTFKRNLRSGALTRRSCIEDTDTGIGSCARASDGIGNGLAPTLSPSGKWLYVAGNGDAAVSRFKRSRKTGKLTPRGCIEDDDSGSASCGRQTNGLGGVQALAISRDGRSLYAVASVFGDNVLVRLRLTRRGALRPGGCFADEDVLAGDACSQDADGIHSPVSVAVSPDGKAVYVAGNADDAVARFNRNRRTGALNYRGCVDDDDSAGAAGCAPGFGLLEVASVAVSPDGKSVYATAHDDDAVAWLRRRRTGAILFRACVEDNDTGPGECAADGPGLNFASDVIVGRDGRSVYALSKDDSAIAIFRRTR